MESVRLEKKSSYYGREMPEHLQDDLTKDILASTKMSPKEALILANEEQKRIQEQKQQRKEDEGDFMYQIKNLEKGKQMVDQSERTAKLYDRYRQRQTKRMSPYDVNDMINRVSTMRVRGGRITRKRRYGRKSKCSHKSRRVCKRNHKSKRKQYRKKRI
jgi:hypothetical protein